MAVLAKRATRVICQGLTGRAATYHIGRMVAYGMRLVGGVTPGKGGQRYLDVPVFDTVAEAIAETGATASLVFVPPANAADAMIEAIDAGVELVVCVTERVPVMDMVRVRQRLAGSRTRLVGPNSQGILVPGETQLGVMTTINARRGPVGIASCRRYNDLAFVDPQVALAEAAVDAVEDVAAGDLRQHGNASLPTCWAIKRMTEAAAGSSEGALAPTDRSVPMRLE